MQFGLLFARERGRQVSHETRLLRLFQAGGLSRSAVQRITMPIRSARRLNWLMLGKKVFEDLTDNEWALVEALFHMNPIPNNRRGRPRADTRGIVNSILWMLASGRGWSKLPGRYPSPPTCRRRFEVWRVDGTIAELLGRLRTSGREVRLRGSLSGAALAKPSPLVAGAHSAGAFWVGSMSWHAPETTD